jgi:hypothetical protein
MSSELIVRVVPSELLGMLNLHIWDEDAAKAVSVESKKHGAFASRWERERVLEKHPDAFWLLPVPYSSVWRPPADPRRENDIASYREEARRSLEAFLNARLPRLVSRPGEQTACVSVVVRRDAAAEGRPIQRSSKSAPILKTVTVKRLANPTVLAKAIEAAKANPVVVKRGKKPVAIIQAVPETMDMEDVYWATDPDLWAQIQLSRASGKPGIPLEEAERLWGLTPQGRKRTKSEHR